MTTAFRTHLARTGIAALTALFLIAPALMASVAADAGLERVQRDARPGPPDADAVPPRPELGGPSDRQGGAGTESDPAPHPSIRRRDGPDPAPRLDEGCPYRDRKLDLIV